MNRRLHTFFLWNWAYGVSPKYLLMKYNCASLVLGTEKMTALFRAIVIAIMMTMCSCTDAVYDDSDVRSGIADLNDRVSKLETLCAQMNSNIGALKEIVDALQGKEYIENVTPLSDNQGYIFTFSSGKSVIVYNGTDGKDGVTPRFKIEDGMWYVSYDDCVSWELLGKATGDDGADAGIVSVTEDDDCVHFEISDGTVITIAKRMPLALSFDSEDVAITTGGASKIVCYTLTGVSENVVVKALAQDGWKAVVTRTSATSGSIGITAPEPIVESEVIVLVCDGSNMTMGAINCMKSTILIAKENYQTDFHGGNIEIPVKANTAYSVSLPAGAASWITNVSTKSFTESTLNLCVSENETACVRRAVISLTDDYSGAVIKTFSVTQSGDPDKAADSIELIVENPGQLSLLLEPYQKSEIKKMKLYGNLNDADCDVICKEMTALEELDLSELAETEIAEGRFEGSSIKRVALPNTLTVIPASYFKNSSLERVSIPSSVKTIGKSAFENCSSLKDVVLPEDSGLTAIGESAFRNCSSITSFYMPGSVSEYGEDMFYGCSSLASFSGPNAKENGSFIIIDNEVKCHAPGYDWPYVDQWGLSLKKIVPPDYVTKDYWCKDTEWYRFREDAESICYENNGGYKTKILWIPGKNTRFEGKDRDMALFSSVSDLLYIYLNCESIPEYLGSPGYPWKFAGPDCLTDAEKLLTVELGPDVRQIGRCIIGSPNLTTVHLNEGLERIYDQSICFLNSLQELRIPDSVEYLGFYCLMHCFNLRKLYLGKGLKYIDEYVLSTIFGQGQNHLENLYIAAPVPPEGYAIQTINPECKIHVPAESLDLYLANDNWSIYASQIEGYDFTDFDFNAAE